MKLAGKWENCLGELCLSASFQCNYTANFGKSKILDLFQFLITKLKELVNLIRLVYLVLKGKIYADSESGIVVKILLYQYIQ